MRQGYSLIGLFKEKIISLIKGASSPIPLPDGVNLKLLIATTLGPPVIIWLFQCCSMLTSLPDSFTQPNTKTVTSDQLASCSTVNAWLTEKETLKYLESKPTLNNLPESKLQPAKRPTLTMGLEEVLLYFVSLIEPGGEITTWNVKDAFAFLQNDIDNWAKSDVSINSESAPSGKVVIDLQDESKEAVSPRGIMIFLIRI